MPIQIKASQAFTDERGIDHTSAYGVITDVRDQPKVGSVHIRMDIFKDQATAELGDFKCSLKTFNASFSAANYVSNYVTGGEAAMLAQDIPDGNDENGDPQTKKLIDPAIWETV